METTDQNDLLHKCSHCQYRRIDKTYIPFTKDKVFCKLKNEWVWMESVCENHKKPDYRNWG